jgi:GNAT superfamily N-acetyltransferase
MPTIEEIVALDLLTLREHTELAGDRIDPQVHAAQVRESLNLSRVCEVRRAGELVAYAMLNPLSGSAWFVRGFNTHPAHRTAPVMKELFGRVAELVAEAGISELRSHVYKTNRLSMAFHRRLGFRVNKENERAVEFVATVQALASNRAIERSASAQLSRLGATVPVER